jgi:threonine/homoserine/homoserine lactone efflux protein
MPEFIAVLCITILAVISPGADFAIITKNSYLYGRTIGVLTALGIALGVFIHVAYTLLALNWIFHYNPNFLNIIRYIGAGYLIYIGYNTFIQTSVIDIQNLSRPTAIQAFKTGFLTNALNPKTMLFVMSTYAQIITTSTVILIGYGLFISLIHFLWFTLLSLVFSQPHIRKNMLARQKPINKTIGSILIILGLLLFGADLF